MNTKFGREIKDKNYTVMSNYHLRDKNISLKAKGLLSQPLSYSSDWVLTIKGLCAISKEQEKAMKNTIRELETHNYLTRQKLQDSKGRFYYKYIIHEKPKVYPGTHNPPVDNPQLEKDIQINTNNKDKLDKDLNNCINNKIIIDNNLILRKLVIGKYISEDDFEMYKYNELIKEIDYNLEQITKYKYDKYGNILYKKAHDLKDNNLIYQNIYKYNNSWTDQLSSFNGVDILYDTIGNPIQTGSDINLTWINGRELSTYSDKFNNISYKYNNNGIRTYKTINGAKIEYYLDEMQIVYEKRSNDIIYL